MVCNHQQVLFRCARRLQTVFCRHRASRLTREAAQTLAGASGGKPAFEGPAWNGCTTDMVRAARAHAHLVLQANFFDRVAGLQQEVGATCEVK